MSMIPNEFLAAIIAEPDDDLPRLVLADWLDERGDPRGEFIRVQCELATMPEECEILDAHRRDLNSYDGLLDAFLNKKGSHWQHDQSMKIEKTRWLCRRGRDSLRKHCQPWLEDVFGPQGYVIIEGVSDDSNAELILQNGEIDYRPIRTRFRRGFIESITCQAADWIRHGDAIVASTPLKSVTLTTSPEWEAPSPLRSGDYRMRLRGRTTWHSIDGDDAQCVGMPSAQVIRHWSECLTRREWPRIEFVFPYTTINRVAYQPGQGAEIVERERARRAELLRSLDLRWPATRSGR